MIIMHDGWKSKLLWLWMRGFLGHGGICTVLGNPDELLAFAYLVGLNYDAAHR